jgi:hypothetical protein
MQCMSPRNSRRAVRSSLAILLTALAGPGCDYTGPNNPDAVFWCTLDCGNPPPPDGVIQVDPAQATLAVGETAKVTATLRGPIIHFSSLEWASNSGAIRVRPLPCSEVEADRRTCAAEVIAVAPGTARAGFHANLKPEFYNPVFGHANITVTAR